STRPGETGSTSGAKPSGWREILRGMSQENVEIVRRLAACGESAASQDPDPEVYDLLDPEIEWDASRRTFDPGVFHGYDRIRELAAPPREGVESGRIEPLEFIPTGDEVVVPVRLAFVSRTDRQVLTANAAHVW